jgi:flagellar protein FliO/FliZ
VNILSSIRMTLPGIALMAMPVWAETTEATDKASGLSGVSGSAYLLQVILALIVVLIGIVALAWFMKRMTGIQHSAGGNLQVLEGLTIGPRERIVLIQAGKEQLVVGIAPGRVQTLHVLQEPVEASTHGGNVTPFAKRLNEALKRRQPS